MPGAPAPWRRGLGWFFVGQLGKYVPGGIWPIVGQAELAARDGVTRSTAYRSTALSMVATLLGAAAVAAAAGLVAPSGSRAIPALLALESPSRWSAWPPRPFVASCTASPTG